MTNSVKSNIQAFRLYGNLYFVGSTKVSVHIIDTEEGLVMIDTGYPDMYEQIIDSIEELGFDPKNICAIFHSHGHIDHYGCTLKFKNLSGAKTYISRIDNDIVNGTYDLSWAKELGLDDPESFNCDVLVEDGDVYKFGSTSIRCVLTPGHTDGVLSFFINPCEDGKHIVAAMHGGIGMNSMTTSFLNKYGLSFDCREKFRQSLHKLSKEHVDLVLGNHPGQSDTQGKLQRLLSGEKSVIDASEWKRFLEKTERVLDEHFGSEKSE